MSQDIKRYKRNKLITEIFATLMIIFGIIVILESLGNPTGISAGIAWILIFGGIPIAVIIKGSKKVPPDEEARIIAAEKMTIPVLGSVYWISDKGIWKNNKLWITWNEIKDIQVFRTWVKTSDKARTFTILDVWLNQGPDAITFGIIRVFLKDGRSYEINNVVDPENLVNYIKNVYLKKS